MDVRYDFSGRIAFVTGAGSGIGAASAHAFAQSGAHVIAADINAASAEATAEAIRVAGGSVEALALDVSDPEAVDAAIQGIVERYGRLDFAHNNAGIEGHHVPTAEIPVDNWRRVVDVDLNAVFYCMRAQIPVMERQGGGAIVNTSSVSGLEGGYNLGAYTAAKHGVVGATRAAAMDHGRSGVRINAVCPGPVRTAMLQQLEQPIVDRLTSVTAVRRTAEPSEIAQAVLWLCSTGASYVTGQAISVDGGATVGGAGTFFEDILEA